MSEDDNLIGRGLLEDEVAASSASLGSTTTEDDEDEDVEVEALDDEEFVAKRAKRQSLDAVPVKEKLMSEGIIAQLIDIREPLINLRRALEKRLNVDLSDYDFWLQDSQLLPENTTLVEQCVQGEGLVQINVEIKNEGANVKKINIVDVLKPAEDLSDDDDDDFSNSHKPTKTVSPTEQKRKKKKPEKRRRHSSSTGQDMGTRWVVCSKFRKEQERIGMPTDPVLWNRSHVNHWIKWAMNEFKNASISLEDWNMDGKDLCAMSHEDFKKKVPIDPSDLMWTHLELLRKCKFVAVVQKYPSEGDLLGEDTEFPGSAAASQMLRKTNKKPPVRLGAAKFTVMSESALGNRTGNNGQVQLWQFLLELLTEKEHREVIHWLGEDGEFKLENPEMVAHFWGIRKNKPNMNYEKLSRALRYYYDGDMISKVHGKRFVYKFVCDLKQLIGYTAAELNALVIEAEQKALKKGYT